MDNRDIPKGAIVYPCVCTEKQNMEKFGLCNCHMSGSKRGGANSSEWLHKNLASVVISRNLPDLRLVSFISDLSLPVSTYRFRVVRRMLSCIYPVFHPPKF
jgi:hypothetical protein